jgi:hypothetical protein
VRRNNFLRENPIGWRFVATGCLVNPDAPPKTASLQGFGNDRARTGA